MDERSQFRVELQRPSEQVAVVELAGEVDIYSSPQFAEALREGIDEGARRVVVDLAQVTFIDSTALGVVVGGIKRLRTLHGTLDVVCEEENLRRIFEITGLNTILGMYRTRAEALAAATREYAPAGATRRPRRSAAT